jgi:hypothetical protein
MNQETTNSSLTNDLPFTQSEAKGAARCQHRTRTGRRCRHSISDAAAGLCSKHINSRQKYRQEADLSATLLGQLTELSSACDINKVLSNLFLALTQDRIAARRAAVLAYIGNLLLRTLPAMDREVNGDPDADPVIIFDLPRPNRSQNDDYSSTIQRT